MNRFDLVMQPVAQEVVEQIAQEAAEQAAQQAVQQLIDLTPLQAAALQIISFIPQLIIGLVIFIFFWIFSVLFRRVVKRYGKVTRLDPAVLSLLMQLVNLVILIIGAITALGTIGLDVTALVAGLGLTSFALGFALQDILSNVLSGVLLLIYRPFRLGHYIKVGDKEGHVVGVDLRYTTLRTDAQYILIPNQQLFREAIVVLATQNNAPNLPPRPLP
ncbi:MAG: mechanosensitive ion channel [bacterium]|nr:mechanosensitive ion channel [bacterium]